MIRVLSGHRFSDHCPDIADAEPFLGVDVMAALR